LANSIAYKLLAMDNIEQWLSTFFVLVHPFKLVGKPVHPCHCTKI